MRERKSTTMQKIAVGLVGTRWNLERYLVESLEEDPWKFLTRVVREGLEGQGLARCAECGTWTRDYLPDSRVCPGCVEEIESVTFHDEPVPSTGRLDAVVAEISREANPATAAKDWSDDPRAFADWATTKLFAAMEAEIAATEGESGPCHVT
jgi:hypothetical protein